MTAEKTLREKIRETVEYYLGRVDPWDYEKEATEAILSLIRDDRKKHGEAIAGALPEKDVNDTLAVLVGREASPSKYEIGFAEGKARGFNQARSAALEASDGYGKE